jgi:hypothetical protein
MASECVSLTLKETAFLKAVLDAYAGVCDAGELPALCAACQQKLGDALLRLAEREVKDRLGERMYAALGGNRVVSAMERKGRGRP